MTQHPPNLESHPSNPDQSGDRTTVRPTFGRRQLLKALAGTGVVATSTLLPERWTTPVVEMGMLPAHAQTSPTATPIPTTTPTGTPTPTDTPTITPTPTNTPTPTPTPIIYAITACSVTDAQGATIGPFSTLATYAEISPPDAGIQIRRTIILNEVGHPLNGVLQVDVGLTDATGRYTPPNYDLSTVVPQISGGTDRITVRWEFVNTAQGTSVCVNLVEVAA